MRACLLLLLALPAIASASGDGLPAIAQGSIGSTGGTVASVGLGGVGFSIGDRDAWLYASAAWPSGTLELGRGALLAGGDSAVLFGGLGGVLSPRGGATAGARATLGVAWTRNGEFLWWRPELVGSIGLVADRALAWTLLAPIETAISIGLNGEAVRPYVRLAAGADLVAGTRITGRGELAIGLAFGR